jgi:hypothetical protein
MVSHISNFTGYFYHLQFRFNRFGHSLNAINTTTYNPYAEADLMILAGGYNPSPDNDVWVTEDGINWL